MSQLSFDFNAPPPSPHFKEPDIPDFSEPNKKISPPLASTVPVRPRSRGALHLDLDRFSWLSKFMEPQARQDMFTLRRWCRMMEAEALSLKRIEELKVLAHVASTGAAATNPMFLGFQRVLFRRQIPIAYPLAFLDGLAMELTGEGIETEEDLIVYAYRLSGSLALMASHVTGLSHPGALKNASDLGLAIQITHIARHIREDYERGHILIPRSWLREAGVEPDNIFSPRHRSELWQLINRLMDVSVRLYASGEAGLRFLSMRSAFAASMIRELHMESGRRFLSSGIETLDRPVALTAGATIRSIVLGTNRVLRQIPSRIRTPWKSAPINILWNQPL